MQGCFGPTDSSASLALASSSSLDAASNIREHAMQRIVRQVDADLANRPLDLQLVHGVYFSEAMNLVRDEASQGLLDNTTELALSQRARLMALSKLPSARQVLVRESARIIEERGRALPSITCAEHAAMRQLDPKFVMDEVIVGGGPHAVAYLQLATDLAPQARRVVLDKQTRVGGTFADIGPALALNTTTRSGQQLGNKNWLYPLFTVGDLTEELWPIAGDLGDVIEVGFALSNAYVRTQSLVQQIAKLKRAQTARCASTEPVYAVSFVDTVSPSTSCFVVYAHRVIVATGAGSPTDGTIHVAAALQSERADPTYSRNGTAVMGPASRPYPRVQYGEDLLRRIGTSARAWSQAQSSASGQALDVESLQAIRSPYRPFIAKRIALVGGGDTADVLAEWFMRTKGAKEAFGDFSASELVDGPVKVYWINPPYESCDNEARPRYRSAQNEIAKFLFFAPGRVAALQEGLEGEAGSTVRVIMDPSAQPSAIAAGNQNVWYYDDKHAQSDHLVEYQGEFDYVVLATGAKKASPSVSLASGPATIRYAEILGEARFATPQGLAKTEVGIAARLWVQSGKKWLAEEVYWIGPGNPIQEQLVPDAEVACRANVRVSLPRNIPRTRALALRNASQAPVDSGGDALTISW